MQPSKPEVAMRSFVLLPFLFITACAPDERMPLSDCDYGLYWAECGGDGEPVLGCDRGNGDCRWFSGGVTARGYAVADKPVLGACPEGWPFSDFGPAGALRERVVSQLGLVSSVRVERDGVNNLPVVFDLAPPYLTRCSREGCFGSTYIPVIPVGTSVVIPFTRFNHGTSMQLEILPGETRDAWTTRLYRTDCRCGGDVPVYLSCQGNFFGREYLTSGTLHLNTDDLSDLDALHGRLEGVSDRGEAFEFEF
jgi:hypothetical protein